MKNADELEQERKKKEMEEKKRLEEERKDELRPKDYTKEELEHYNKLYESISADFISIIMS